MQSDSNSVMCLRCGGSGKTRWVHVDNGICYACDGTGEVESKPARRVRMVATDQTRSTLRAMYRNARAFAAGDERGLRYSDLEGGNGTWTLREFSNALDAVPGSREVFRNLGWPV